ncbi:MAG: hypothetical protein ACOYMN_20605 [Roseimicrobium sp.]
MTDAPLATLPFTDAARLVQTRWVWRKGLLLLLQTWPHCAVSLAAVAVFGIMGYSMAPPALSLVLVVGWACGCLAYAWRARPGPFAALSWWDQQAGRSDAFANAWWFEQERARDVGQQLHLDRERARLPEALTQLRGDIALPDVRWLGLLPLAALVLLLVPVNRTARLPDPALSAQGRELAEQRGRELAETKIAAAQAEGLTAQEKSELEKLQQRVGDTARTLRQGSAQTTRSVLSELEKRARDAEKLAEKLGAGDAAWASEQLVAEMRRHADTAELGDAVAQRSTEGTARQAEAVAGKLREPALSADTRDRFAATLRDIGKQAQPEDEKRTVGQHVLRADRALAQALPHEAAKEFQSLADAMRLLAARDQAREKLEQLAQQLRQTGSDIAGQGAQGLQQLAGNPGPSQGPSTATSAQLQALQNATQPQSMMPPGFSNAQPGQNGPGAGQSLAVATPSQGANPGKPLQVAPAPGPQKDGQEKRPLLIAPIPGQPPDGAPNLAILGLAPGSSQGGLPPSGGTSKMEHQPTEATKPGQASIVNAQRNAQGTSAVRTVEGQAREEKAARSAQATAIDAIATEEAALDDQPMPTARREQVRRYFTELRRRFETRE